MCKHLLFNPSCVYPRDAVLETLLPQVCLICSALLQPKAIATQRSDADCRTESESTESDKCYILKLNN